ncbi:hypothetical protein WA158_004588 [Blastocystis sp. Blastoise]
MQRKDSIVWDVTGSQYEDAFKISGTNELEALFSPNNVALIGATDRIGSVGQTILFNLITSPFGGGVIPINPKKSKVLGIPAYKNIKDVPEHVDLAIICIPSKAVLGSVRDCGEAGVRGIIVISAGFKEVGPEGLKMEQDVVAEAKKHHMRVIGPNCLGLMRPPTGLNASFANHMALKGHVGFISQSGALMTAILDWSLKEGLGYSAFISIGSMADIDFSDLIYYLGDDEETHSILIYMESIGNASAFLSAAREVALRKPIIVIKPGRSAAAAQAAASHTGSLTGSDDVLTAAFKRVGVVRVNTIEELFYMADVLDKQPRPQGPRLSIITNAGGPGVICTDELVTGGGALTHISDEAMAAYNSFLPSAWSHHNPIDILGDASPAVYAESLKVAGSDANSDGMLVILTPQSVTKPTETARELTKYAHIPGKPVLAAWMGGVFLDEGRKILREAGIPAFGYPDAAAKIFNYMWEYSSNLESLYEVPAVPMGKANQQKAAKLIADVIASGRNLLTEAESKELLASYGIPTVQTLIAETAEDAAKLADSMGYPVVVKLNSETITHKSDVGGVQLNLKNAEQVKEAFNTIKSNLEKLGKVDGFQGVTVQLMLNLSEGYEVIFGCNNDPQVGPIIVFGTGGTLVEVYKDSSMTLPPVNTTQARNCMKQTKIYKALQGVRGKKGCDQNKLDQVFVRFSELVSDQHWIKELDINPMFVSENHIVALDARVVLYAPGTPEEKLSHPAIRPYPYQYCSEFTGKTETYEIRPIRPSDIPAMKAFEETLSEETVKNYFANDLALEKRLSHSRLIPSCFIDYERQIALVAETKTENGETIIAGTGRICKVPNTNVGRLLVCVSDKHQKNGLGKYFVEQSIKVAQEEKLSLVFTKFNKNNTAFKNLLEKYEFTFEEEGDNVVAIKKF